MEDMQQGENETLLTQSHHPAPSTDNTFDITGVQSPPEYDDVMQNEDDYGVNLVNSGTGNIQDQYAAYHSSTSNNFPYYSTTSNNFPCQSSMNNYFFTSNAALPPAVHYGPKTSANSTNNQLSQDPASQNPGTRNTAKTCLGFVAFLIFAGVIIAAVVVKGKNRDKNRSNSHSNLNSNSNPCGSYPCLNGGTCFKGVGDSYDCRCTSTFTGYRCENKATACSSAPCRNGGTCNPTANWGYTCTCSSIYNGTNCEECAGNPCRNEGRCIAVRYMPLGYSCICRAMFRGTHCELDFFGKLTDNSG